MPESVLKRHIKISGHSSNDLPVLPSKAELNRSGQCNLKCFSSLSSSLQAAALAWQPCNLHRSLVVDQLQRLVIQSPTSLKVLNKRVDGLSVTVIVMVDCEDQRPCLQHQKALCFIYNSFCQVLCTHCFPSNSHSIKAGVSWKQTGRLVKTQLGLNTWAHGKPSSSKYMGTVVGA